MLIFQTIESTLELVLPTENDCMPADDEQREEKHIYSHEQLCEIQSKLMLIAGKQQENNVDVSRFVEVTIRAQRIKRKTPF